MNQGKMGPLPPNSALVRDGQALSLLPDEAFALVAAGKVPPNQAAHVTRILQDPKEQTAAVAMLARLEPATSEQARLIVEQMRAAGFRSETVTDLFGGRDVAQALLLERAKVLEAAGRRMKQDKAAFENLLRNESTLAAAGNVLARDANVAAATDEKVALTVLETLATRHGPISTALNDAARKLSEGASVRSVLDDFVKVVRVEAQKAARGTDGGAPIETRSAEDAAAEPSLFGAAGAQDIEQRGWSYVESELGIDLGSRRVLTAAEKPDATVRSVMAEAMPHIPEDMRSLAERVLRDPNVANTPVQIYPGLEGRASGRYIPMSDDFPQGVVQLNRTGQVPAAMTFLHEAVHAATVIHIMADMRRAFAPKDLRSLMGLMDDTQRAYRDLLRREPDAGLLAHQMSIALERPYEFVTYGLTSPAFRAFLKSTPSEAGKSVWRELVEWIGRVVFGIDPKKEGTLLDRLEGVFETYAQRVEQQPMRLPPGERGYSYMERERTLAERTPAMECSCSAMSRHRPATIASAIRWPRPRSRATWPRRRRICSTR